jgi:hypothetical protein
MQKVTSNLSARAIIFLIATFSLVLPLTASPIVTNWVAYNDHRPGPLVPPWEPTPSSWGTAVRATILDMGAPGDTSGNLVDFLTGNTLPVTVTFTRNGAPNDFGAINRPLDPNTPAGQLFYGICDLSIDGIVGVDSTDTVTNSVLITFAGLNPEKRYVFRGTVARNGGYAPRWTVATIMADGWIDAHIDGTGPGVITSNDFPANLGAGQAAWNSGHNAQGAVVGWDFITPTPEGSFSITCEQYIGPTPNGGQALIANYGYSFGAFLLAEVEVSAPVITAHPAALTMVEQNRPFSLSVAASGTPLLYQWYKEGVGEISGATFPTYSVAQAALGDSGNYYAVVYNPLARATSTVAQVSVFADTTPPSIASAYAYPNVDPSGVTATLDQIMVEFNEPVQAASVNSPANYTVPGGGNPTSVIVTNERTVTLMLASPLAEDTAYSVTASGARDAVGNVAGPSMASFRTWVRSPGNGLLYEAFQVDPGTGVEVTSLLADPDYPDNAFLRTNLPIYDSRLVFPDDTQEDYGSRIRGVFIPPVSGNWVFFLRTYDRGYALFNPNGLDPAGTIEILRESTGNEPRNWDKFTSPAFPLRGGQGYYIESLQKAATGTDVIKVAARLAGSGFPQPVDIPNTEVDTNALVGAAVGSPLAPRDLGGSLTILQQPMNTTVADNHIATFSVQVNNPSGLPVHYQWFRDDLEIPGATGPSYSFLVTSADDGFTFSVRAAKLGSVVMSQPAALTVVPDTNGPVVLSVVASLYGTNVTVAYDEPVDPLTGGDNLNYVIDGFEVQSVMFLNPSTVALVPNMPLEPPCARHTIEISGVVDPSQNPINPSPTIISFITPLVALGINDIIEWRYNDAGIDLGTSWREPGFDDSSFELGLAVLAWEPDINTPPEQPIRTELINYTNVPPDRVTIYFRGHFNLPTDPANVDRLQLWHVLDDGAVYYLNGVEVNRTRMPTTGTINFDTLATVAATEPHPLEGPVDLPPAALVSGANVLAVEVHQNATTSSDIVFGAELIATISACRPRLFISREGDQVKVTWTATNVALEHAQKVDGPWDTVMGAASPYTVPTTNPTGFYRLRETGP